VAEAVEQVLLNDQASRACAHADPLAECAATPLGAAGWPRTAHLFLDSGEAATEAGASVAGGGPLPGLLRQPVEYRLHEFGLLGADHAFGYWPGFTLNPALWDVAALNAKLHAHHQRHNQRHRNGGGGSGSSGGNGESGGPWNTIHLRFNASDLRFEQSASLQLAIAGVRVAYLQRLSVKHLGTDASAYELNGLARPWDRQSPATPLAS
jgi:hypothetical protein